MKKKRNYRKRKVWIVRDIEIGSELQVFSNMRRAMEFVEKVYRCTLNTRESEGLYFFYKNEKWKKRKEPLVYIRRYRVQ